MTRKRLAFAIFLLNGMLANNGCNDDSRKLNEAVSSAGAGGVIIMATARRA